MCGIVGAVAIDGLLDLGIRASIRAMTDALGHRGPDGAGYHVSERAVLGHRRLAIIDRAGGGQPLSNEDGTVHIVFNGEVYNHAALRAELSALGHVFRTRSDTEAIVHAWEEWGTDCPRRLEGMFAFAILDERRGELFLARDRLGKKPLFWAALGGALHFASEVKALERSPAWEGEVDPSALEGFLTLGYFVAPSTIWRGVRKLEPGCWLRLSRGRIETGRYWDLDRFDDDLRGEDELAAELDGLLARAVADRLESEVPLGAFLSGGLDSGLVVSYMAGALGEGVLTATVGFGDAAHDELAPAALTAERYGTRHHAEVVQPALGGFLDEIVAAFDEPFADSSAIPTWYVSRTARRHVTVALTGDGGDETFGGYSFRYVPHALEDRVRRCLPGRASRALGWLGARWPRSTVVPRALRWGTVLENVAQDAEAAYFLDLCFQKPADARVLMGAAPDRDPHASPVWAAVTDPYRRCPSADPLQRAMYADLKVYLPNDVLVKVDRMSMRHALEVRCPLLDHRITEFAFRIPSARRMAGLVSKRLLRRLAATRLPPPLLSLGKRGFTAPVGRWIGSDFAGDFRDEVLAPSSRTGRWIDRAALARSFDEHRRGVADRSFALWAVWVLERWLASRETAGRVERRRIAS